VQEAALILHVTDISNPHHAEQDAEVMKVLADLGVQDRPRLHVLNKTDQLSPEDLSAMVRSNGHYDQKTFVSAATGAGLEDLLAKIDAALPVDPLIHLRLRVPLSDGRHLSLVYACGRVLHSEVVENHLHLDAELPQSLARQMEEFVVATEQVPRSAHVVKS
jgi:GTP-binding protein HflX